MISRMDELCAAPLNCTRFTFPAGNRFLHSLLRPRLQFGSPPRLCFHPALIPSSELWLSCR
uniref:Uncharacterized protein n=1 Tax=Arundo donax TaxID=35708 RepID=A0A0A9DC81_ARUDO